MDQKLKDLTEKLFKEGVAKGNQQADQIVVDAKNKSKEIIAKAEVEAKALLDDAVKKAAELEKNTKSELKLASNQMISSLQQEVVNLVNGSIVESAVKYSTDDKTFVQQLLMSAVTNWAEKQDLLVVVAPDDQKAVESFFTTKAKKLLDGGLKIESANKIKAGFQIGPADGSYKVSFTQEDFIAFFKAFIRPKIVELLFDGE